MTDKPRRHRWSKCPRRFVHKTERDCLNPGCKVTRVTRHEGISWIEFWRDGEKIDSDKTPPCEGQEGYVPR